MKTTTKNILLLLIVAFLFAMAALPAFSQGRGFDSFAVSRTIVLANPVALSTGATILQTNISIDTHGFDGIAVVDISSLTNSTANSGITAQLFTSSDTTNWTALANFAVSTAASQSYTNLLNGNGTVIATQTTLYPGVITTPTSATAGWSTPYLAPALFTNTGSVTITTKGFYKIGYNVSDASRYLQIVFGGTNATCSAEFTGNRAQ